jgi:hypothetical protein
MTEVLIAAGIVIGAVVFWWAVSAWALTPTVPVQGRSWGYRPMGEHAAKGKPWVPIKEAEDD